MLSFNKPNAFKMLGNNPMQVTVQAPPDKLSPGLSGFPALSRSIFYIQCNLY